MATIQIPLRNDLDDYEFTIDLDGRTFNMQVQWNSRASQWSLILKNDAQAEVVGGIPLVVNSDLIGRFMSEALPQGILTLFDTSGANRDPDKADLGVRCLLLYSEAT
jgi:hypothetical protein